MCVHGAWLVDGISRKHNYLFDTFITLPQTSRQRLLPFDIFRVVFFFLFGASANCVAKHLGEPFTHNKKRSFSLSLSLLHSIFGNKQKQNTNVILSLPMVFEVKKDETKQNTP